MSVSCDGKLSDVLQVLAEEHFETNEWENDREADTSIFDQEKQDFTDAVYYCLDLLKESHRLTSQRCEVPSERSKILGREMFEKIVSMDICMEITTGETFKQEVEDMDEGEEEITSENIEVDEEGATMGLDDESTRSATSETERAVSFGIEPEEPPTLEMVDDISSRLQTDERLSSSSPHSSDTEDETDAPYPKPRQRQFVFQLEVKRRVIALASEHVNWSLAKLRKEGSEQVRNFHQLRRWEKQLENGGSTRDKHDAMNVWTLTRFVQARESNQHVTDKAIKEWASHAARKYFGHETDVQIDDAWIETFVERYEIRGDANVGYFRKPERKAFAAAVKLWRKKKK